MKTVDDLKRFLEAQSLSPEAFGRKAKISNMTIRRLLAKPAETEIPARYRLQMDTVEAADPSAFGPLLAEIEAQGKRCRNPKAMLRNVKRKLGTKGVPGTFAAMVRTLAAAATSSSPGAKALALGALAYFLNPFDLIPDAMVPMGFIDDFAVLSLAVEALMHGQEG